MSNRNRKVYVLGNVKNRRLYVGATVKKLKDRIRKHFYRLKKGIHRSKKLQEDYDKHGKDVFEYTLLEEGIGSAKELDIKEHEWASLLNAYTEDGGYTTRTGGNPTDKEIEVMSSLLTGENNPWYGITGSAHPGHGVKHNSYLTGSSHPYSKPVVHIESGKEFESQSEASRYFGYSRKAVAHHVTGRVKNPKFEYVK